jgi:hypothetical protein
MKDKPTKPKPTRKTKPKATPKRGSKTPGGGGAKWPAPAPTTMDSDPEKKMAIDEEPSITVEDAAFYLMDGTKKFYKDSPHAWDSLLLLYRDDPKKAKQAMFMMGAIMRKGIFNVHGWSYDKVFPEVTVWAQALLADLCTTMEKYGLLKLPKSPVRYGAAFAARWNDLHPVGRKGTKYAAIKLFAFQLLYDSDRLLSEIWNSWKQGTDDEPAHKKHLRLLVEESTQARANELPGDPMIHGSDAEFVWHIFRRHPVTREMAWEKILWPLAQATWPKFARENEHFTGTRKWKLGQPLSDMKRPVDERTDFGTERHYKKLKGLVFDRLDLELRFFGGGEPPAT